MLSYLRKGSWQDPSGHTWVFYGDNIHANQFYIVPKPNFVFDDLGNPVLKYVTYETDDTHVNGSGYLHFQVELTVPVEVQDAIRQQISQQFPDAGASVLFQALDFNPGATAILTLQSADKPLVVQAAASEFGANTASFTVDLSADMMKTVQGLLSTSGGGLDIKYVMSVPALLQSVNATLTFDSSIAFQYQVTHPVHRTWGSDTPGSVQKLLKDSQASTVEIEWMVSDPSEELVDHVTDWANDTLQSLISENVNAALETSKMTSQDSFNISSISSFKHTYSESQVIDWWIYPEANIPSLADLGKSLSDFTSTVDTRQETITINAHLPFTQDSANAPNVPQTDMKPVLLDHVTVTVKYPGLSQADATYTFTENGSRLFTAPYAEEHGASFDLIYTAAFKDNPGQVTGTITNINQGEYSLAIQSVGILSITFDASQAFMTSQGQDNPLEEVDITFNFIDGEGLGTPITERVSIHSADETKQKVITSLTGYPINSAYNYTVTYVYNDGTRYEAPTVQNANGFNQIIPKINAVHETNLILAVKEDETQAPIVDVTVNIWYEQGSSIPGVKNQPSKDSPAVFKLEPKDKSGWIYAQDTFLGFINQNLPIVYSGSIDSLAGQTVINAQRIANTQASIIISPTQRYFTLEMDVSAIDWNTATYSYVEVLVTPIIADNNKPQESFKWSKGNTQSNFATWAYNDGQSVQYDWKIIYITPGSQVQTSSGQGASDTILNIPASPAAVTSHLK